MIKLAIIHFHPIELYPPVLNLINYIAERSNLGIQVKVYTMKDDETLNNFNSSSISISILRKGILYRNKRGWKRYLQFLHYGIFYTGVSTDLLAWQPSVVLYYETLSSLPAIIYKQLVNKKSAIMIHYHEYSTLQDYNTEMKLNKWFHSLEKKLYHKVEWLSHTNDMRLQKFLADHSNISIPNTHILPNFPPLAWKKIIESAPGNEIIKVVYVGSLSLDTMYTKEFAAWVLNQNGKFIWHIYSGNISSEAKLYITSLETDFIVFKGHVDYYDLPNVLSQYHTGVVLYKGFTPNYVYNAPNKLFEYFACNLDVWFPLVMQGCLPYITIDTYPVIAGLSFNSLNKENIIAIMNRSGLTYKPSEYFCEYVLCKLADKILETGNTSIHSTL